ncbi:MAG: Sjogren's syndrome/scleroderma autoantigen 1 family protein [Candidatus Thorarchaeota archaeon]
MQEDAEKMADLLRAGYTMLNLSCPVCNNPLFRNKNKEIFCPICNKKVIIEKNDTIQSNITKNETIEDKELIKNDKKFDIKINSLKEILEEKIKWISQKLKDETHIDLIERYINILTKTYKLLNKIIDNSASAGI